MPKRTGEEDDTPIHALAPKLMRTDSSISTEDECDDDEEDYDDDSDCMLIDTCPGMSLNSHRFLAPYLFTLFIWYFL